MYIPLVSFMTAKVMSVTLTDVFPMHTCTEGTWQKCALWTSEPMNEQEYKIYSYQILKYAFIIKISIRHTLADE